MHSIDPTSCALVLVDYQQRLMPAIHDGAAVTARAAWLADVARRLGIRVLGTEQNPAALGPNDESVRQHCDLTIAKTQFDACEGGLLDALCAGAAAPAEVVVAGCEAHVCLMQTALGLRRAGFRVWTVADASGSRRPSDRDLALPRLAAAGATPVSAEMVAFEWLRGSQHPKFRELAPLLKAGPKL